MAIPTGRIIDKLDSYYASNNLKGAEDLLTYWEEECRKQGDNGGLLTISNEQIGFYRRNKNVIKGRKAIDTALSIVDDKDPGSAVIYVNIATTLKSYGDSEGALKYYSCAKDIFEKNDMTKTYEFAAFLNNYGTTLADIGREDEAMISYENAVTILKELGTNHTEIAVSYVNMAHVEESRDPSKVEMLLDMAWEELNNEPFPRGGSYAFAISKCAPSFEHFGRAYEARALMEVADEIYKRS
ncbi:MAG: hypothetical protein J6U23_15150 [Clostridiales bacterium]|nr:hypothetical protein [Clostridiales bacterium]